MKLKHKGKVIKDTHVKGVLSGLGVDAIEFNALDMLALHRMKPKELHEKIGHLLTRYRYGG